MLYRLAVATVAIYSLVAAAASAAIADRPGTVASAPVEAVQATPGYLERSPVEDLPVSLEQPLPEPSPAEPERRLEGLSSPFSPTVVQLSLQPAAESFWSALEVSSWPENLHGWVERVARCESGLNPAAVGDGGRAIGLMQIRADMHPELAATHDLFDPRDNLEAAWLIFTWQGYGAWTCT